MGGDMIPERAYLNRILKYTLYMTFIWAGLICSTASCREPNAEELEQMIQSPIWTDRWGVADKLISSANLDTNRTVQILLNAIRSEIENPVSTEYRIGSYRTISETLLQQYFFALVSLGPSIATALHSYADSTAVSFRPWPLMALGFLKDQSIYEDIKRLTSYPDPLVRSMAISALVEYGKIGDISIFERALSDSFSVKTTTHIILEDGKPATAMVFPIREQAISALRKLNLTVSRDSAGKFIIVKPK